MSFWGELRRRNVVKVGVAYAVVAWLLIQVASVVLPTFAAPEWVAQSVTFLLILLLPVVLIIAWAFEITPEGIKKTAQVPLQESITHVTSQKLNYVVTTLLVLAVVFMAIDNYVLDGSVRGPGRQSAAEQAAPATDGTGAVGAPASAQPSAAAGSSALVGQRPRLPNSVAVLPFANMSPNADDSYFAAGIHEEILNYLAKLKSLNIIARTSMLQYADTPKTLQAIAEELNVETIMEGSVRYSANRVRVTTQLIDAATGVHLWSEAYERDFADIFAIQADIAMNVANALEAEFSEAEQQSIETAPTTSADAYALYLQVVNRGASS
jgi:TolB-like protein